MTPDDADVRLARLAAAVEDAIPDSLRRAWERRLCAEPVLVARQAIFGSELTPVAYHLSYRAPGEQTATATTWSEAQHDRATAHVLSATFGRADIEHVANGLPLVVRCTRPYLVGDLKIPALPERLVVEIPHGVTIDTEVLAGVARLREAGFRIGLPSFVSSLNQRLLLPYADFVKIDVRDLDVEGSPVVQLARSHGARLVAEFIETPESLDEARALGFTLFQGNLLERAGVLDRAGARPVQD
ncbi:EAL domain-containing protein [Cellulomonas sp. HZM]|uniref:EAL domain-containing protein n=1 Tax=Cellulomonas sp. HZM TaxID=1454010 RepID=UPI0005545EA5|nr:EAL domain-containing protein [Cellulomonas sp. HZM]